jgi:hypothetical protein
MISKPLLKGSAPPPQLDGWGGVQVVRWSLNYVKGPNPEECSLVGTSRYNFVVSTGSTKEFNKWF